LQAKHDGEHLKNHKIPVVTLNTMLNQAYLHRELDTDITTTIKSQITARRTFFQLINALPKIAKITKGTSIFVQK
jgi:hypothetical protein